MRKGRFGVVLVPVSHPGLYRGDSAPASAVRPVLSPGPFGGTGRVGQLPVPSGPGAGAGLLRPGQDLKRRGVTPAGLHHLALRRFPPRCSPWCPTWCTWRPSCFPIVAIVRVLKDQEADLPGFSALAYRAFGKQKPRPVFPGQMPPPYTPGQPPYPPQGPVPPQNGPSGPPPQGGPRA